MSSIIYRVVYISTRLKTGIDLDYTRIATNTAHVRDFHLESPALYRSDNRGVQEFVYLNYTFRLEVSSSEESRFIEDSRE